MDRAKEAEGTLREEVAACSRSNWESLRLRAAAVNHCPRTNDMSACLPLPAAEVNSQQGSLGDQVYKLKLNMQCRISLFATSVH